MTDTMQKLLITLVGAGVSAVMGAQAFTERAGAHDTALRMQTNTTAIVTELVELKLETEDKLEACRRELSRLKGEWDGR